MQQTQIKNLKQQTKKTMIRNKVDKKGPIVIDLTGPDGNAFVLLGKAKSFAKAIGMNGVEAEALINDMTSGDYEHLIQVFDKHFGSFVILER